MRRHAPDDGSRAVRPPRGVRTPALLGHFHAMRTQHASVAAGGVSGPSSAEVSNSRAEIARRAAAGRISWAGLALMLCARSILSFLAQALVAGAYALQSSADPWLAAARWLPIYAGLIDAGCLAALWWLTRREGIALFDLMSFDRSRWGRDVLLGLALIPARLAFIYFGIWSSSELIFGTSAPPALFRPLPLIPAIYAVLVFPAIWGITEEMTYNGYVLPRFQVLSRSTVLAVVLVALVWSFQHVLQPMTFHPDYMLYRLLSPIPHSVFVCVAYLRIRRLLPFVIGHWLMNAGDVLVVVLLPLFA